MNALDLTRDILSTALQLGGQANQLDESTSLLGGFPEFNSLTITTIITAIEEQLDCSISDAEISAEIFETVGTLAEFIRQKME
jgi:acyl carrier protein